MNDLIKAQENANKVANIIKDLDKSDQQSYRYCDFFCTRCSIKK